MQIADGILEVYRIGLIFLQGVFYPHREPFEVRLIGNLGENGRGNNLVGVLQHDVFIEIERDFLGIEAGVALLRQGFEQDRGRKILRPARRG